jgi:MoxR-like ATPase
MSSGPPPPLSPADATGLSRALVQLNGVVLGKEQSLRLALCCLIARGHLLIEDLPGVGKTTLAGALARTLGLDQRRIQFTSDLLPADILGTSVFDRERGSFAFHPGPVFAQVVLADEINRATPRTQSALLEAMEEGQVTADGRTHPLPAPFFVIATQNPSFQLGTYPLPESQLDRFLMRIDLGYPDRDTERAILAGPMRKERMTGVETVLAPEALLRIQEACNHVHVAPPLRDYLLDLLAATRVGAGHGLSPRAGLGLQHAARAWALLDNRSHVLPEDVQAVAESVMAHRLSALAGGGDGRTRARELIARVPVG